MSPQQTRALEQLAGALDRFENAYLELLLASVAVEEAMTVCREVNDVKALSS